MIGEERFFGQLKHCQGLFARYTGKLTQEFIYRFATLKVFKQMANRDSRSGEARDAAHSVRIHVNDIFDVHSQLPLHSVVVDGFASKVSAVPSDVRKAFALPESAPSGFRAMPSFVRGAAPVSSSELDGSAERFRTSDGIADSQNDF
jgi:hypothetical protein